MIDIIVYHTVYNISIIHIILVYYFYSEIVTIVCQLPNLDVLCRKEQGKP